MQYKDNNDYELKCLPVDTADSIKTILVPINKNNATYSFIDFKNSYIFKLILGMIMIIVLYKLLFIILYKFLNESPIKKMIGGRNKR
jgi:hypothetical protein